MHIFICSFFLVWNGLFEYTWLVSVAEALFRNNCWMQLFIEVSFFVLMFFLLCVCSFVAVFNQYLLCKIADVSWNWNGLLFVCLFFFCYGILFVDFYLHSRRCMCEVESMLLPQALLHLSMTLSSICKWYSKKKVQGISNDTKYETKWQCAHVANGANTDTHKIIIIIAIYFYLVFSVFCPCCSFCWFHELVCKTHRCQNVRYLFATWIHSHILTIHPYRNGKLFERNTYKKNTNINNNKFIRCKRKWLQSDRTNVYT